MCIKMDDRWFCEIWYCRSFLLLFIESTFSIFLSIFFDKESDDFDVYKLGCLCLIIKIKRCGKVFVIRCFTLFSLVFKDSKE